jgi:hypothetical protein
MNTIIQMKVSDLRQLTPGTPLTFTLPGKITNLAVQKIDTDHDTIVCDVLGSPNNETMTWSLSGIDTISGLSR